MGIERLAVESAHEQLQRELDAARLAVVSLLAVMTDEQFRGVETALLSVAAMSETSRAALEELRTAGGRKRLIREEDAKAPKGSSTVAFTLSSSGAASLVFALSARLGGRFMRHPGPWSADSRLTVGHVLPGDNSRSRAGRQFALAVPGDALEANTDDEDLRQDAEDLCSLARDTRSQRITNRRRGLLR